MIELTKDRILEKVEASLAGRREGSKEAYINRTKKLIEFFGVREKYTAEDWSNYLKTRLENAKPSYKVFNHAIFKRLMQVTGSDTSSLPRPPDIPEVSLTKTDLSTQVVSEAINRISKLSSLTTTCLVLGTIYGFRNKEMSRINSERFDRGGYFQAPSVKKSLEKWHVIPEEIEPYLNPSTVDELHDWANKYKSPYDRVHKLFYRAFPSLESSEQKRYGWHTVRRTLVTQFDLILIGWKREKRRKERERLTVTPLPFEKIDVNTFLRWKGGNLMFDRYSTRREEFGKDEQIILDDVIFEHHPFLKYWKA